MSKIRTNHELELISAILLALFFGAEFFKFIGLTGEIGALIMGVCLSNYKYADKLAEKNMGIKRDITFSIFYFNCELKIDIDVLKSSFLLLFLLIFKSLLLFFLLIAFKLRAYTVFFDNYFLFQFILNFH